jgi:hypothetical protein
MKTFNITETEQGNDFGNFQAEDERGALEALANDAGYKSYADMLYVTGGRGTLRVTEVEDLSGADLSGADLSGANLRYADLSGADLSGANLPSPTMVLLASWGDVNPELCRDLMIYNAACHPDPSAFTRWANRQSGCPYASAKVQRAADFQERREYWSDTAPLRRPYDLMVRVLAEKCPAWTGAQQAEFNGKYKGNVSTQSAAE